MTELYTKDTHRIGGLMEVANFAKAVGVGIAAAWEQLLAGNFSGIGAAFGDAFMAEFTRQADVKAPNAFKAFGEAYESAAGDFNKRVAKSGGMSGFLGRQRQDLLDSIAKKEAGIKLPERSVAERAVAGLLKPAGLDTAAAAVAKKEKTELPKALELGSAEAWKKITESMYGDKKEKHAETTAKNTERIARATEELADREVEEVGVT